MESARLVRWLKKIGDSITQGEPLLELETEKIVVTIEATATGRLVEVLLESDQEARVGDRIAWIESEAASSSSSAPAEQPSPAFPARVRSSPVAGRLSKEHGLDLARIAGTGPQGRVQLDDVRRAVAAQSVAPGGPQLSSMRRAIARA